MDPRDSRLHAIADGVEQTKGEAARVALPIANLHKSPAQGASLLTQALLGESVTIFSDRDGWSWVKLQRDGYVGHMRSEALSRALPAPTHRISVPHSFLYPGPSIKTQPHVSLTLNAAFAVENGDEKFVKLAGGGYVYAKHVKPITEAEPDFVETALRLLHAPYLWGGKSTLGIDCSGLVQLSLEATGRECLRDSDMQEETMGASLRINDLDALRRGDLVFWNGHVGIMTSNDMLLHANGHFMQVTHEPLREAVDRIAKAYGEITSLKRLNSRA